MQDQMRRLFQPEKRSNFRYLRESSGKSEMEEAKKNSIRRINLPGQLGETPEFMPHPLMQHMDDKNEQEIKQERRKQSIRESVRRSRLKKKAETEELARRVESLTAENLALKSEVVQLKLEKLGLENAALMVFVHVAAVGTQSHKTTRLGMPRNDCDDEKRMAAVSTENLLSGAANKSASIVEEDEATMYFLHTMSPQLLPNKQQLGDRFCSRSWN